MEKHVKALLSALRQAVNEAILGSHDVNAALAALSRAGRCPSLAVDVTLDDPSKMEGAEQDQPDPGVHSAQANAQSGELVLTGEDEEFLESLGIRVENRQPCASEAPLK